MRRKEIANVRSALLAGSPVQLFGARGMGKHTLLERAWEKAYPMREGAPMRIDVDLNTLPGKDPDRDPEEIRRALVTELCRRLGADAVPSQAADVLAPLERGLKSIDAPVTLVLTGAEVAWAPIGHRLRDALIDLSQRTANGWEPWDRLRLVLIAHLPLELVLRLYDPYVLVRTELVSLGELNLEQAVELVQEQRPEWSEADVDRLMTNATGGSPLFLSILARAKGATIKELIAGARHSHGPFKDYFTQLHAAINRERPAAEALRDLVADRDREISTHHEALFASWGIFRGGEARIDSGLPAVRRWVRKTFRA